MHSFRLSTFTFQLFFVLLHVILCFFMTQQDLLAIKQRFGIIGNSPLLNRDIEIAVQVARTDLSVLITGESGVGKEHFPKVIHAFSARKHGPYFAVNCGAIPEGTIDSELFGHEKGAFTDAKAEHKGYFEIADGGTLFLDEVGELPMQTQVRLLRVLETGEYLRMGSSTVRKTNVRVVAATNLNMRQAIDDGRFREDLYYRLNTVEIRVPALRERKEDIPLLFRKFAVDFCNRYQMPPLSLNEEATRLLQNSYWRGNIRQLKNLAEQMSVIELDHQINADTLRKYLPQEENRQEHPIHQPQDCGLLEVHFERMEKCLYDVPLFSPDDLVICVIQCSCRGADRDDRDAADKEQQSEYQRIEYFSRNGNCLFRKTAHSVIAAHKLCSAF